MKKYGLIGYPVSHSFSKKYFTEKFNEENLEDCRYELFELREIEKFNDLLKKQPELKGLNVTVPHKEAIIPYLDVLDQSAKKVGAVNVVKITSEVNQGFNTDYFAFRQTLQDWLEDIDLKALVLGSGGASKAVKASLDDLNIPYLVVSRSPAEDQIGYQHIKRDNLLDSHRLIINTTPLGMHPKVETFPGLDYNRIGPEHFLYDLVYNPQETRFLAMGSSSGAKTKNGLEMLYLQAEKSWEIWSGGEHNGF